MAKVRSELLRGDCLLMMEDIPDASIDLVLTDPPYGTTACKWDTVIPFKPMWKQLKRITKRGAPIVLFGTQPFSAALIMSNLEMFKYEWVWDKVRAVGAHVCKIRPMAQHENILVFGQGKITYFPQKGIPYTSPRKGSKEYARTEIIGGKINQESNQKNTLKLYTSKTPTTILVSSNASNKNRFAPTQKPVALMEYLVQTYSQRGDTVLDFTMGSGTTGVACKRLRRDFIGIENDPHFYDIAKNRIFNTKRIKSLIGE